VKHVRSTGQTVALVLVAVLLIGVAAPALAQDAATSEPVRRLLEEMAGKLHAALEEARAGNAQAAVQGVQAYLGLLRQLDQLLPPLPAQPKDAPPSTEAPNPRPAGVKEALERQGALLAAIAHLLPPEARTEVFELLRAEIEAGYQHPQILRLVRRAMAEAAQRLRRQQLEQALERARAALEKAIERATRLQARARELEARLDEITDPARRELAAKRVKLAWLDHEIALKVVERFTLLVEILEEQLARLNPAP